ncbi:MAG: GTPase Era, partial [Ignavibacteriaceae bacterium]
VYLLQEKMMEFVDQATKDADVIIFIIDIKDDPFGEKLFNIEIVKNIYEKSNIPKLLILNKIDLSNEEKVKQLYSKLESSQKFKKIIPIAASLNINLSEVIASIVELLPEGSKFYPDDIVADANERFFVSEIIREKILEFYQEEIPYSCEVVITDFKERDDNKDFISAEIFVERDSQKGIIIGKQGNAIKKLGEKAREEIEKFLQRSVYLDLRVKVKSKWRSDEKYLKSFGYFKDKD